MYSDDNLLKVRKSTFFNYSDIFIFQTLNSVHRHHHHSHPWGPHFEENPINITVDEGGNTGLDCRVGLIEDKLVIILFFTPIHPFDALLYLSQL